MDEGGNVICKSINGYERDVIIHYCIALHCYPSVLHWIVSFAIVCNDNLGKGIYPQTIHGLATITSAV